MLLKMFPEQPNQADLIVERRPTVNYDLPNTYLYSFNGRMTIEGQSISLDEKNVVLRGTSLKSTEYIIGVVLYCGHDTKIMMNSIKTTRKKSNLEHVLSYYIISIFIFQIALCLGMSGLYILWLESNKKSIGYLNIQGSYVEEFFKRTGSWILVVSNLIPISLMVTIEMVRFIQAIFIAKEKEMVTEKTGVGCVINSSNMNDELGQIDFVFSDKTGTLTCNEMKFKHAVVGDVVFGKPASSTGETREWKRLQKKQTLLHRKKTMPNQSISQTKPNIRYKPLESNRTIKNGNDLSNQMTLDFIVNSTAKNNSFPTQPMTMSTGKNTIPLPSEDHEIMEEHDHSAIVEYVDFKDSDFEQLLMNKDPKITGYLRFLSVCHSVTAEKGEYNATSPDELALVYFARAHGFRFIGKDDYNNILVSECGTQETYRVFYTFEFTSARKRMSVVFQDSADKYWIYTKGADNVIIERANRTSIVETLPSLKNSLDYLASQGLRTLLLARKEISEIDFLRFEQDYQAALNDIHMREQRVEREQNNLERELEIIGATAIEDKLQDKVPETIRDIKAAGIKMWVLTGDKVETAVNIGMSCNLLKQNMTLLEITEIDRDQIEAKLLKIRKELSGTDAEVKRSSILKSSVASIPTLTPKPRKKNTKKATIVSGDSLIEITQSPYLEQLFLECALKCEVVLCCRVSPKQKQEVVKLVKTNQSAVRTLAIGDGANDVNMIIEAHVGVGISGVEGQQASKSADYAIGEFRHLKRLLFVHGRESYRKNSVMVLYNFWKNALLVLTQLWYALIYNNFSGMTLYEGYLYQLVNVAFSSVPIIVYAVLDREVEDQKLERIPKYYKPGPRRSHFNIGVFAMWMFMAIAQACIVCVVCSIIEFGPEQNGQYLGFWGFGVFVFSMVILLMNLKIFIISSSYSPFLVITIILSFGVYVLAFFVVNKLSSSPYFTLFTKVLSGSNFWVGTLLVFTLCFYLDYLWNIMQRILFFKFSNVVMRYESLSESEKNKLSKQGFESKNHKSEGNFAIKNTTAPNPQQVGVELEGDWGKPADSSKLRNKAEINQFS
jgi:phospholipid-transporting ATPase